MEPVEGLAPSSNAYKAIASLSMLDRQKNYVGTKLLILFDKYNINKLLESHIN